MCGIFFKCVRNSHNCNSDYAQKDEEKVFKFLALRGPDCHNTVQHFYDEEKFSIDMRGYVLWMQGKSPETQPVASNTSCLLFNGDLFETDWVKDDSDTKALFIKLDNKLDTNEACRHKHIISVIQSLNGPFSLMYLDKLNKKLYFCRDRIGRRSLLFYINDNEFILSSVLSRKYKNAVEVPSEKIYCLCLKTESITEILWTDIVESDGVTLNNWHQNMMNYKNDESDIEKFELIQSEEDLMILNLLSKLHSESVEPEKLFKILLSDDNVSKIVDALMSHLSNSVEVRVKTQPDTCQICINNSIKKCDLGHGSVGVLFSGGLDCTILAALAHKHLSITHQIDLFNVAFKRGDDFNGADRITSRMALLDLREQYPERCAERIWNLVEIDVTTEELHEKQKEEIADLIYPLKTVLDDSIGSAFWFAARGTSSNYKSPCRILLTGIGADELFGGYTRHRNAYKRGGWNRLEAELQMDWKRLSSRNLARDDRVISHHSRQPRMPYLDEKFVQYVLSLKPWQKCCLEFEPTVGNKLFLRLVARKLGLNYTSGLPKRAIQFGSRIANKKENAKDISQRLLLE